MGRKKILIVDDNKDLIRGLNVRLNAYGYEVVVAMDGYAAINVARKEKPDLVILDIGLPAGDGFTVLQRMGQNPSLALAPVLVLTARDAKTNKERALKAGATAFFQKPVDNEVLLAAIQNAVGKSDR